MKKFEEIIDIPKPIIRNSHTARYIKTINERNRYASKTIPDQTMSIQEIMDRHARGLPISGAKVPIYDADDPMPDMARMDLVDIQEMREIAQNNVNEIQQRLLQQNQPKKKAKLDENENNGAVIHHQSGTVDDETQRKLPAGNREDKSQKNTNLP